MAFEIGQNVGQYRITEKLGQGGMATVYRAYQPNLDRVVAIKVLHSAFMADPSFVERFEREARIVAKLEHPNIVPIFNADEHEGQPYLVMKFIEGETLKARLSQSRLTLPETLTIIDAVAAALTFAHQAGVLHRDVKPSNVLLEARTNQVYLADFGLARMADAGESTLSQDVMLGTPHYISPEQAQGIRDLTAATDIYSLGVILYEIVVGRVPFMADTPYAIVHDHIFAPLPLPTKVNPNVPPAVETVLLRALAKDPRDRFASAVDMAAAFRSAVTDAGLEDLPSGSYRVPLPATAQVNSGTTALETPTPRPDRTPVLPPLPGSAAGSLPDKLRTITEQRRRRNRRRQQANLWIFIGVAGLILTCLAGTFVIVNAFADPLVRVVALAPDVLESTDVPTASVTPSVTPSAPAASNATITGAGPVSTSARVTAMPTSAPVTDATSAEDLISALLNGSGSAEDRAVAARILYQRANTVSGTIEAAVFRRLANDAPRSGDAAALAALASWRAGQKADAQRLITRALTLSPESRYVQFINAILDDEQGNSAQAISAFKAIRDAVGTPDWLSKEITRLLKNR